MSPKALSSTRGNKFVYLYHQCSVNSNNPPTYNGVRSAFTSLRGRCTNASKDPNKNTLLYPMFQLTLFGKRLFQMCLRVKLVTVIQPLYLNMCILFDQSICCYVKQYLLVVSCIRETLSKRIKPWQKTNKTQCRSVLQIKLIFLLFLQINVLVHSLGFFYLYAVVVFHLIS